MNIVDILSCKKCFHIATRVVEFRGLKFERSSTVSHCNNGMLIYMIEIGEKGVPDLVIAHPLCKHGAA